MCKNFSLSFLLYFLLVYIVTAPFSHEMILFCWRKEVCNTMSNLSVKKTQYFVIILFSHNYGVTEIQVLLIPNLVTQPFHTESRH